MLMVVLLVKVVKVMMVVGEVVMMVECLAGKIGQNLQTQWWGGVMMTDGRKDLQVRGSVYMGHCEVMVLRVVMYVVMLVLLNFLKGC